MKNKKFTLYLLIGYGFLSIFILPKLIHKPEPAPIVPATAAADWPYKEARTLPVVTTKNALNNGKPILFVFHDAKDNGWQFLDAQVPGVSDLTTATLEEVVGHDESLHSVLADLKPGWAAFRKDKSEAWTSAPQNSKP